MNKRILERYEKHRHLFEQHTIKITNELYPWIAEFCEYKDWMVRTSNRPSIDTFEIYGSRIECQCSIYAGCGEVDKFEISVPIEYVLGDDATKMNLINSKKEIIENAKKAENIKKLQYEREVKLRELERLNKELGGSNEQR